MQIIRDENLVQRRKKIGQITSLSGLVILIAGMAFTWLAPRWGIGMELALYVPFVALLAGFILSNIGIYFTNRWVRSPRPDEILDSNLKGLGREYKLYHFALPVQHLLLTPSGPIVLIIKTEPGTFTVDGDKWRQRFSAMRLLRFMGQEGLGNPTREARYAIDQMRKMLAKRAPELVDEPIMAAVVFLADQVDLNVGETEIAVIRGAKLKGYLRSMDKNLLAKKQSRLWEETLDSEAAVNA